MQLYCVRHGESEATVLKECSYRSLKRGLTETGKQQAHALIHSLQGVPVVVLCRCFFIASLALHTAAGVQAQQTAMTFFITSVGPGKGGDLGGLAGADRHCQTLAQAVGAGGRTWHAYLSTSAVGDQPAVNARDRIGQGPWQNAHGVVIARDIDELHGNNSLNKQTALTEKGEPVHGRGDTPNMHDILTGSQIDGRAFPGVDELGEDRTCHNWTSSDEGAAMVGHHDRRGLFDTDIARSWNAAHASRGNNGGCSQEALRSTGGNGLFYCFAVN